MAGSLLEGERRATAGGCARQQIVSTTAARRGNCPHDTKRFRSDFTPIVMHARPAAGSRSALLMHIVVWRERGKPAKEK